MQGAVAQRYQQLEEHGSLLVRTPIWLLPWASMLPHSRRRRRRAGRDEGGPTRSNPLCVFSSSLSADPLSAPANSSQSDVASHSPFTGGGLRCAGLITVKPCRRGLPAARGSGASRGAASPLRCSLTSCTTFWPTFLNRSGEELLSAASETAPAPRTHSRTRSHWVSAWGAVRAGGGRGSGTAASAYLHSIMSHESEIHRAEPRPLTPLPALPLGCCRSQGARRRGVQGVARCHARPDPLELHQVHPAMRRRRGDSRGLCQLAAPAGRRCRGATHRHTRDSGGCRRPAPTAPARCSVGSLPAGVASPAAATSVQQ